MDILIRMCLVYIRGVQRRGVVLSEGGERGKEIVEGGGREKEREGRGKGGRYTPPSYIGSGFVGSLLYTYIYS